MKRIIPVLACLCMLVVQIAFVTDARAQRELIVSAAASLTNAFDEIGKKFEGAHPGTKVVFNFAASGALLQQIDQGAPVDVFATADQKTMDQAKEKNLILPDTRKDFTGNELVLIVPSAAKVPVATLKDLAGKEIGKLALGNPDTVPAGRYAREVLTNEGLWDGLQSKLIFGNSVRQVLDYVSRGEVDAGFVFASDTGAAKDQVKVVQEAKNHKPIAYPIAIVKSSSKQDVAKQFVDFVLSGEGQGVLKKHGFTKP
ncbi:MAG: molybdate ABC transporter substrate-binding protein [Syntrophobacter sp.]